MKPIKFQQSTIELQKPEGMTDDECSPLPVYRDGQHCISLWQPTLKERLSILFYGHVWLWVWMGNTQPPVALEGRKTVFEENNNNGQAKR
jgi:hypothetical protein